MAEVGEAPTEAKRKWPAFLGKKKKEDQESEKADDDETPRLPPIPYFKLYRFCTGKEKILVFIAFVSAALHGAILPMFTIIFGKVIDSFQKHPDISKIVEKVGPLAKWFFVLGAIAFFLSWAQVTLQLIATSSCCGRIRRMYFESILRQDATWFDEHKSGELTARISGDINTLQKGLGDKFTVAVQFIATFFVGIGIAFGYSWRLTLIILAVSPILGLCGAVFGKLSADTAGDGLGAYGSAGAIASEALGLIRTVTAYSGQEEEATRYEKELDKAYKADCRKAVLTGVFLGLTMAVIMAVYSMAFYFGALFYRQNHIGAGDILITFFAVLIATISIGQAAPSFAAFAAAQGAAPYIFEIIDRKSEIDPLDASQGRIIDDFQGHILFENVDFNYKSRNTQSNDDTRALVLEKFNLDITPGSSQALVGPSGCGKSTTVRLVERLYDVSGGRITFDGIDIRELNVRWLRSQIGYVGQMPTLFRLTIKENIALGAAMDCGVDENTGHIDLKRMEPSMEQIIEAAKQANAHDFISKLPEGYDTLLGERGAMLSGGQKQRICIARALIRNPRILILDESTAALDAQSERIVQEALESASMGRTTITIAHRLSTVKNADRINVLEEGIIIESGTHDELIGKENGAYRKLVELQNVKGLTDESEDSQEEPDEEDIGDAKAKLSAPMKSEHSKTHGASLDGPTSILGGPSDEEEESIVDKGVLSRAFQMNKGEWYLILVGIVGSGLNGASWPALAYVFARVIGDIVGPNNEDLVRKWCLLFLLVAAVAFVAHIMQFTGLGISGELLTRRIRARAFRALLRQEMAFFDEKKNSVGALSTKLASESTLVKGVTGDILGGVVLAFSSVATGIIISFTACWSVALVVLAVFPFMAIAGNAQMKMMAGFDGNAEKLFADSGTIAAEATDNMDAVSGLGLEDYFSERYGKSLEQPLADGRKSANLGGISYGFAEFVSQALWAIAFWAGSAFVQRGLCGTQADGFTNLMTAISALLFAGMSVGQATMFFPDIAKSKVAATQLFRLLDRESKIDPANEMGLSITKGKASGVVSAEKLKFEYPSRPDIPVLRGLNLQIEAGKTVALVGESGCGKSTIVSLVERFYDPRSGSISFDNHRIEEINLLNLRSHIGFVSQEPDLFNRSVRDNIAYGLSTKDGSPVTDEMIIEAAKLANAHGFISELPEKYDSVVGPRGSRLSGGQRQRVAIARSLVRNPKLLLLDEATSALDAASESIVQKALDSAAEGRTTIAIAHRLSTVKDADAIAVVARGKIVELGTHTELLQKNGRYALLVKNQMSQADEASQS